MWKRKCSKHDYSASLYLWGGFRKMKKKDFKIIDEGRGITVKIKFEANDTISYVINDDKNYFSNKDGLLINF